MSSTRYNVPYITREIKSKIRQKRQQYNKARKTHNEDDWILFRKLRSEVQKSLRTARWNYVNEIIGPSLQEKPKAFYQYVKKMRQDSTGIQQLFDNGSLKSSGQEKAYILGKQFMSVFTAEPDDITLPSILPSQYAPMRDIEIHPKGVEKLLKKYPPAKQLDLIIYKPFS